MEARMKKYKQEVSPDRAKVLWKEKSPKYFQNRKVPVVYYLSRNRQLEHPHFMEVTLSSPRGGLYLKDVICKLDALRGRGMASLYSWSCKRSYKNGFVWHDLSEDDLIQPAHGSEYVLKGSELFCESNSVTDRFSPISNVKMQSLKQLQEPVSCRSRDESSSSSSMNERDGGNSQEDDLSTGQHSGSSDVSPESTAGKTGSQSLPLTEYKIYKTDGLANASTQTEEYVRKPRTPETCTRGVSTEEGSVEPECHEICENQVPQVKDNSEICIETISPPLSISSPASSGGKTETLESLIRADASKMNSFRILEDDGIRMHTNSRMKASNLLMQLISCGSISVKNHSLDLIPSYKARFSHSKFPSPLFSNSVMLGELDCIADNPKATGHRSQNKEYFSGSIVESKMAKEEDGRNVMKRSSSFNAESAENSELKSLLEKESLESDHLHDEVSSLQEEIICMRTKFDEMALVKDILQNKVSFLSDKLHKLVASYDDRYIELSLCGNSACLDSESKDSEGLLLRLEELQCNAFDRISLLIEEKKILVKEKQMAQVSLNTAEFDALVMKQKFESDLQQMASNTSVSGVLLQKLESDFEVFVDKINAGFKAEEIYSQHHNEFLSILDHLGAELQQLNSRNQDLSQEIINLGTSSSDLEICKLTLAAIAEEKKALEISLQEKTEESAKISSEINYLNNNLHSLHNELHDEKNIREKLEKTVTDLTTELNEKQHQLWDSDMNRQELVHLKQLVTELEFEKSRISELLQKSEKDLEGALKESSSTICLETHLSEMHEFSIATDVVMIFTRTQFEGQVEELTEELHSTCRQLDVLHEKNLDVESELNVCLNRELTCMEENIALLTSLDYLKSELEVYTAQCRELIDQNSAIISEPTEHKSWTENVSNSSSVHESEHVLEVVRLEQLLASCSRDREELFLSNEEGEVKCIVLQAKLDEVETAITSLKQSDNELTRLQNQCSDLTRRLSEQVLKTEEFKNLSIHLKELKDKAEAECVDARERRGHVGPPAAMQESLRIAFIKEQYETKLQELKQQLSLSKKHNEEMLWKLQDATDEIENRKTAEASQIKINEELGGKILELEAELQTVISDKRNLLNANDLLKAEKECSVISLECCKQEKQELETSLLKCSEEKSKFELELTVAKESIETLKSNVNVLNEGNDTLSFSSTPKEKSTPAACSHEPESANSSLNMQPEDPVTNGCQTHGTEEDLQQNEETKHIALAESLKSSIDHLNKELERMKNENMLPSEDGHNHEPSFPGLQRELMQLHEANQELGKMFPVFNKISIGGGNALERVLALEIELAEALQDKKSSIQFQSSFTKQHSDEEAVFRSFKDINELIKDMLEIKARHSAVETELKEMHDRYSQLSLQFAEVEGERQKLMMTLKNTRVSKKAPNSPSYSL